jgi:hypothetical protein
MKVLRYIGNVLAGVILVGLVPPLFAVTGAIFAVVVLGRVVSGRGFSESMRAKIKLGRGREV